MHLNVLCTRSIEDLVYQLAFGSLINKIFNAIRAINYRKLLVHWLELKPVGGFIPIIAVENKCLKAADNVF